MTKKHVPHADVAAGRISRRHLVQGAASLGLAAAVPVSAASPPLPVPRPKSLAVLVPPPSG